MIMTPLKGLTRALFHMLGRVGQAVKILIMSFLCALAAIVILSLCLGLINLHILKQLFVTLRNSRSTDPSSFMKALMINSGSLTLDLIAEESTIIDKTDISRECEDSAVLYIKI